MLTVLVGTLSACLLMSDVSYLSWESLTADVWIAPNRQVLEKETQHGGCMYIQDISDVVTVPQQGVEALLSELSGDPNSALLF